MNFAEQEAKFERRELEVWREMQSRIGLKPLPRYESMGLPPGWTYFNFKSKKAKT